MLIFSKKIHRLLIVFLGFFSLFFWVTQRKCLLNFLLKRKINLVKLALKCAFAFVTQENGFELDVQNQKRIRNQDSPVDMCAPYLFVLLIQNAMNSLSFNGIIFGLYLNFPSKPGFYADMYLTFIIRILW